MGAVCYGTHVLEMCPCAASVIVCVCLHRCRSMFDECTSAQAGCNMLYKNLYKLHLSHV